MNLKKAYLILFIGFTFFLWNCASQGILTGGEPDEDPPKMEASKSTENYQTNFYPNKIELVFDEYIQLKNPLKEIGISPPLKNFPKFKSYGKKLTIDFSEDEVLRDSATYTINFGNAIQDFREGNILENFTFVFGTGDKLDSLRISGKVYNALDGKPIENAVVLLYDNLQDSAVYSEKPFYFDKTDKEGNFIIENIKQDSFSIYAITDENLSYTWDSLVEDIAFANAAFELTDSFDQDIKLFLSKPGSAPEVLTVEAHQDGKIKCGFSSNLDKVPDFSFSKEINYLSHFEKDSLFIWYDTINNPSFSMYIEQDTFKIKPKSKKKKKEFSIGIDEGKSESKIVPSDSLRIFLDYPILTFNKDSIIVQDTSKQAIDFELSISSDKKSLKIEPNRLSNIPYNVSVRDSSLISFNGVHNDSFGYSFEYLNVEQLGVIHFVHDSIASDQVYVLQLLDGQKEIDKFSFFPEQEKLTLKELFPKKYSLIIIEDRNKNGKWDPADFTNKIQPERIAIKELDKLKENWELEVEISSMLFNNFEEDDPKGK